MSLFNLKYRVMKKIILSISLLLIVASASFAQKVNVAAAANLRYVLEEIKNEYQTRTLDRIF